MLRSRFNRVLNAMNTHLWSVQYNRYTNALFNGSAVPRWGPTSVFPLISGSASDAQAAATAVWAASPEGLCLNRSYFGPSGNPMAAPLVQW